MLILIPPLLIVVVSVFLSFRSAATFKKNVVLNVTLPQEAQGDPRVVAIIAAYERSNLLILVAAVGIGALILLAREVSLFLILFTVWLGLFLTSGSLLLNAYTRQLMSLKVKEEWSGGARDVVRVDLVVSREKAKMPVSRLWLIPPLLIAAVLLAWGFPGREQISFGILALGETLLFSVLYSLSAREPARAYSHDRKVNLAMTRLQVRGWTLLWVGLANLHGFFLLGSALVLRYAQTSILGTVIVPIALATLGFIVLTGSSIRRKQNRLLQVSGPDQIVDEDHYWQGWVYNNPHDQRILVEKRVGYGQTLNIGTKKGRILYYGTMIGVGALIVGLFFVFLALDTMEYALRVSDDQVVVEAPLYGFKFATQDIQSISLLETLPRGMRTNGAETARYAIGNFTVTGFGKSKLFIYKNRPPYIVIELEDLHVLFNTKTQEGTEGYYRRLESVIP